MYRKYGVQVQTSHGNLTFYTAAPDPETAREIFADRGKVFFVEDITDCFPIDSGYVRKALQAFGFGAPEVEILCSTLDFLGITTPVGQGVMSP